MQLTTVILKFLILKATAVIVQADTDLKLIAQMDPDYGFTWMFLPDGDGNTQIAYLVFPNNTNETNSITGKDGMNIINDDDPQIYYYLYRKNTINNPKLIKITDSSYKRLLSNKDNFDISKDTKIVIHGWKNTYKSNVGQFIKNAYLNKSDYNIFVVDWSSMADDNFYIRSAYSTRIVGKATASLIDYLVEKQGTNIDKVHVIGHSLGAQTAGFTGMHCKSGKIGRITGLDPAKPLFTDKQSNARLDPTDAQFVDIIHTCSGIVGADDNLGHVDFWPNGGGMSQPGCTLEFSGACSHGRSYEYFADSITYGDTRPYLAYPCTNFNEFRKGRCLSNPSYMGDQTPNTIKGSYFLMTRSKTPYALIW